MKQGLQVAPVKVTVLHNEGNKPADSIASLYSASTRKQERPAPQGPPASHAPGGRAAPAVAQPSTTNGPGDHRAAASMPVQASGRPGRPSKNGLPPQQPPPTPGARQGQDQRKSTDASMSSLLNKRGERGQQSQKKGMSAGVAPTSMEEAAGKGSEPSAKRPMAGKAPQQKAAASAARPSGDPLAFDPNHNPLFPHPNDVAMQTADAAARAATGGPPHNMEKHGMHEYEHQQQAAAPGLDPARVRAMASPHGARFRGDAARRGGAPPNPAAQPPQWAEEDTEMRAGAGPEKHMQAQPPPGESAAKRPRVVEGAPAAARPEALPEPEPPLPQVDMEAFAEVERELQSICELEEANVLLQKLPELVKGGAADRYRDWAVSLERVEGRVQKELLKVQRQRDEVLEGACRAGAAIFRAIQQTIDGNANCAICEEGAMTLDQELATFADDAAKGHCGLLRGGRSPNVAAGEAAQAAADLWGPFGDVQGYTKYLKEEVGVTGADVPLSGGAAWQRMLSELEVAMSLVHLDALNSKDLSWMRLQAQGAQMMGQTWEDIAHKLMHLIAVGPLQSRVRYAIVRVAWTLRRQKVLALAWLRSEQKDPTRWLSSSSAPMPWQVLESNDKVSDLVFGALDSAAEDAATPLLDFMEAAIFSGCRSPQLLMNAEMPSQFQQLLTSGQIAEASDVQRARRSRVAAEVRKRKEASQQVPAPKPGSPDEEADSQLRLLLGQSFCILKASLTGHILALAGTSLSAFTRHGLDEVIGAVGVGTVESQCLQSFLETFEAHRLSTRAEERLGTVRRCLRAFHKLQC